jgi:hypothetical protein
MLTTTIALLAAFSGPMQAGPSAGSDQLLLVADSAHTLFTPNAPDPGRAGQIYELPQGGFGVTTGGTSHYQTLGTPGGSGITVPNGNTASFIGSGGRIGIVQTPN